MNGLDIDEGEFKTLPVKEQNTILYRNIKQIKASFQTHAESDIKEFSDIKFIHKWMWATIGILFILAGLGRFFGII